LKPKEKKQTFADFAGQFANKPFAIGGYGENAAGYDCMGLVYSFITKQGKNMPNRFGNFTLDNYAEIFKDNKLSAIREMYKYFDSFAAKIEIYEKLAGDIVVVKEKENDENSIYPAICVGNGNIMASYVNCGVKVLTCKEPMKILRVWRVS